MIQEDSASICGRCAQWGHNTIDCCESVLVKICIKCASTDHLVENCAKYWTDKQSKAKHRCINCVIRKEISINHKNDTRRKYFLEQIINRERIFVYLVNTKCIEITKFSTYDDLKNTVIKACSSDAVDLLSKPTKVDPYLALKAANSLFPNASKENKLSIMKKHFTLE